MKDLVEKTRVQKTRVQYYQSDLPSQSSFSQEIQLWKRNSATETLKHIIMKNMKECS